MPRTKKKRNLSLVRDQDIHTQPTICTSCRHYLNLEPGSPREDVWYNHLCLAVPHPRMIDFCDGKVKPYSTNALGQAVFEERDHAHCRVINNGSCWHFQPTFS